MPEVLGVQVERGTVLRIVYKTAAEYRNMAVVQPCTMSVRVVTFLSERINRYNVTWNVYSLRKRIIALSQSETPEDADAYAQQSSNHPDIMAVFGWYKADEHTVERLMAIDNGVGFRQLRPERIARVRLPSDAELEAARLAMEGINIVS